jgi:diaminopimelate epimerase
MAMDIFFTKYQGTGNDFILIDNRSAKYSELSAKKIAHLCDRRFGIGADGLMLLENLTGHSFKMVYYNADGFVSSMCGNGGRCIVAFAKQLGIIAESAIFMAIDGAHYANISDNNFVELKMIDVQKIESTNNDFIVNTGSPHYVKFVTNVASINVSVEGSKIRNSAPFKKDGINVNFIEMVDNLLHVRTFERGVENEIIVKTKGGDLHVSFNKKNNQSFTDIWLKGAATKVFEGTIVV